MIARVVLCLALFVAANALSCPPVKKFDANRLLGTQWYEAFYADNQVEQLNSCTRCVFTDAGKGKITFQYGYNEPGINDKFFSKTLTLKQSGSSGRFDVTDKKEKGELIILDSASNNDWIVIANTNENYISVLSKTPLNLAGLNRALELSERYDQDSHHLELQVPQCPYTKILTALWKERK